MNENENTRPVLLTGFSMEFFEYRQIYVVFNEESSEMT